LNRRIFNKIINLKIKFYEEKITMRNLRFKSNSKIKKSWGLKNS